MSYRDDLDAAQSRIGSLEKQLQAANAKISALKNESTALTVTGSRSLALQGEANFSEKLAGGPLHLKLSRKFSGTLSPEAISELVDTMRQAYGEPGQISSLTGSFVWSTSPLAKSLGPRVSFFLITRGGETELRAEQYWGRLAGGIYGGIGGGVGGGFIMLLILAITAAGPIGALALPLWFGGVYAACRSLFKSRQKIQFKRLNTVFDELSEMIPRLIGQK